MNDYTINNYRSRKIKDKYFLTTDHGSFCILTEEEFKKLQQGNLEDDELFDKLEEREIVITDTNIGEVTRLTKNRYSYLYSGTSLHIVVVTLRCNMNCIYCQASSTPDDKKEFDMDSVTAKKTVDFIFQSPNKILTIEFQGGEPLLNWDVVKEIIEYAQDKNKAENRKLMISIVTNMTLMDEEKMNYLIQKGVAICTSLDGPKELHNKNRPYKKDNHEEVTRWIKRINEEYKKRKIESTRVNALVTLTKASLKYPKEIIDEYIELGLSNIHLRFLNYIGVAKTAQKQIDYTVEEFIEFWNKSMEYIKELQGKGVNINERMISIMLNKITKEFDPGYLDLRSPCGASIGQLAYNYNGDIYTCDEARMLGEDDLFRLGNVKDNLYKDMVTCDKACAVTDASINDQYMCDACAYKPYCGICPVVNYIEQGSIIGKISETNRCKIFMSQFDWVLKNYLIKDD